MTTTTPTATPPPVASQPGPPEATSLTRPDPLLRRPRSVAMPSPALVGRFSQEFAERITGWQDAYARAMAALGSAEDMQPGGRDYLAAIASTMRVVRDALVTGRDPDEEAEVEQLAGYLRDEPATRLARAVVEVVKSDVILDGLLTDLAADMQMREQVDAAIEKWVAGACRRVDSDGPGVVEQVERANATEWRPLAGLLVWLGNPRVGYRLRPRDSADARLVEALVMHTLRHGRPVHELPYQGGAISGVMAPGSFEPTNRYDPDGRVLVEASMPTLAIGAAPAPEPPPAAVRARSRWGWLSA